MQQLLGQAEGSQRPIQDSEPGHEESITKFRKLGGQIRIEISYTLHARRLSGGINPSLTLK